MPHEPFPMTNEKSRIEAYAKRHGISFAQAEAALAVPTSLIQDLVRDSRYSPTLTSPSGFREEPSRAEGVPAYKGHEMPKEFWEAKAQGKAEEWLRQKNSTMTMTSPGSSAMDMLYPTTFELEARRKAQEEAKRKAAGKK